MLNEITLQKQALRQDMLVKRRSLTAAQRTHFSEATVRHFSDHPTLAFAAPVALYIAMRGEMDVLPIYQWLISYNKTACLPYSHSDTSLLSFHPYTNDTTLSEDDAGAMAPPKDSETIAPAVILVPLLAFDNSGNRLGYGAGYYDNTLKHMREDAIARQHPPPLAIGVAYSIQEAEHIPTELHDERLDGILTEQGVSMF